MNTKSFEQQLQHMSPPVPDPAARLRAKRAALAEFRRVHALDERKPAGSKWSWKSPWLGGFATACVAVVGVSLFWLAPENERRIQLPSPAAAPAVPAPVAVPQIAEPVPVPAPASEPVQVPVQESAPEPALAPPALAKTQASGEELSEVQVTGTRVLGPNVTSVNPVTSITGEEMRQMGIVNVADALTQLVPKNVSASVATSAPPGSPAADRSQFYIGNTIANLRGLDPSFGSRTLTLVDGRRVVSSSNQADVVDLNTIPSNLLQRMDVVTGGASATYGSAAMAGVVNLVLNPAVPSEGGDKFEHFDVNAVKRVADEPVSTLSIDVDTASYSFSRRILNQGQLPPTDAVRVEEMINYFSYGWPAPTSRQEPLRPTITISDSPWGEGKKLVHIGIKGYELPVRGKPDVNLVLLLDVSGSMNSPDKLPLALQSMSLLLDSLQPTDTVAIAVYAGAAGQVLPPTPVRNRAAIQQALSSLRAGGSTAGAQGIKLAYEMAQAGFREGGVNRILLATDGDFNVGIANRDELKGLVERERTKGIYLSVLGFGQGNYRDEVAQTLAQNGNGVAAYIDTLQEARKVLVQEATSSLFNIASDVKIQVEFNPGTVAEYRLVGYETRALNREDFNNDKVDAGDVGSGHTVTAIYEITPVGSKARLIEERRYAASEKAPSRAAGKSDEYGFLKIRYKLPGESESRLMQQPIRQNAGVPAAVRKDVAFSTAVAGFAQLLRGGSYVGDLSYDAVISQAESALGEDQFGYRAEFVQLARKARDIRSPMCSVIDNLDAQINLERQQLAQQQARYGEQHLEVLSAKAQLASTEATRAAEVARAATVGVVCRELKAVF